MKELSIYLIFLVWATMWSCGESCFKTNSTPTFMHYLKALFLLSRFSIARRLKKPRCHSTEEVGEYQLAPYPDIVRWKLKFVSVCFGRRQSPSRISCKSQRFLGPMFSSDNWSALSYSASASEHVFFSSPSRISKEPSFWCEQPKAKSSVRQANSEPGLIDFKTASPSFPR